MLVRKLTWAFIALVISASALAIYWAAKRNITANEYCLSRYKSPAQWISGRYYCRIARRGHVVYWPAGEK